MQGSCTILYQQHSVDICRLLKTLNSWTNFETSARSQAIPGCPRVNVTRRLLPKLPQVATLKAELETWRAECGRLSQAQTTGRIVHCDTILDQLDFCVLNVMVDYF